MAFLIRRTPIFKYFPKKGVFTKIPQLISKRLKTPSMNALSNSQNSFSHVNHLKYELVSLNLLKKSFLKKGVLGNLNVIYMPTCHYEFRLDVDRGLAIQDD